MYADTGLPLVAVRAQVASALEIIVQTSRMRDGSRKITEIAEILPLDEHGEYHVNSLFQFRFKGLDKDERILGELEPTGNRPTFYEDARRQGYPMEPEWFGPERSSAEVDPASLSVTD